MDLGILGDKASPGQCKLNVATKIFNALNYLFGDDTEVMILQRHTVAHRLNPQVLPHTGEARAAFFRRLPGSRCVSYLADTILTAHEMLLPFSASDLRQRLQPLIDAGLLSETQLPTWSQISVATARMIPYVFMPKADDRSKKYKGARFGHPVARTLIVMSEIGLLEHLKQGSGLRCRVATVLRHLLLVIHSQDAQEYDMQLLMTHTFGLEFLADEIDRLMAARPIEAQWWERYTGSYLGLILDLRRGAGIERSVWTRRLRRKMEAVIPDVPAYLTNLKAGVERAQRGEFAPDSKIPDFIKSDYFSLARFLQHCYGVQLEPWQHTVLAVPLVRNLYLALLTSYGFYLLLRERRAYA